MKVFTNYSDTSNNFKLDYNDPDLTQKVAQLPDGTVVILVRNSVTTSFTKSDHWVYRLDLAKKRLENIFKD